MTQATASTWTGCTANTAAASHAPGAPSRPQETPDQQRVDEVQRHVDQVVAERREPPQLVLQPEGRVQQRPVVVLGGVAGHVGGPGGEPEPPQAGPALPDRLRRDDDEVVPDEARLGHGEVGDGHQRPEREDRSRAVAREPRPSTAAPGPPSWGGARVFRPLPLPGPVILRYALPPALGSARPGRRASGAATARPRWGWRPPWRAFNIASVRRAMPTRRVTGRGRRRRVRQRPRAVRTTGRRPITACGAATAGGSFASLAQGPSQLIDDGPAPTRETGSSDSARSKLRSASSGRPRWYSVAPRLAWVRALPGFTSSRVRYRPSASLVARLPEPRHGEMVERLDVARIDRHRALVVGHRRRGPAEVLPTPSP